MKKSQEIYRNKLDEELKKKEDRIYSILSEEMKNPYNSEPEFDASEWSGLL